ncbi:alpha/beta hydrolase [Lewinella sp. LCG006]|uniref:alpha/beta hydrolase n=1 Tax=Lewinella sp. LCG006 TaxID=3231911 RepID=UPI0034616911
MKSILLFFCFLCVLQLQSQEERDTFSYREIRDIPYLSPEEIVADSLQRLHLVLPEGIEQPSLLLWIGGGAWSFVDRNMEMNLARQFARRGIAVAAVGHRLSSGAFSERRKATGVQHPSHIQDIAAAFKWLQENGAEYGYNAKHIFVGGFSSGAHLAALLATDERYLAAHGLSQEHIRGIIPVAGAYDLVDYYNAFANSESPESRAMAITHVNDVFGDALVEASPTTYLDQLKTPMLLISEGALYEYTKVFEEKIWASTYRDCQIFHVFNFNHAGLWRDISNAPDSQTRKVMIDFIKRNGER